MEIEKDRVRTAGLDPKRGRIRPATPNAAICSALYRRAAIMVAFSAKGMRASPRGQDGPLTRGKKKV